MSYSKVDEGPTKLKHIANIKDVEPMGPDLDEPMSWLYCPMCYEADIATCDCPIEGRGQNYHCLAPDCDWRHITHRKCVEKTASSYKHIQGSPIPRDVNTNAITNGAIRTGYYANPGDHQRRTS